MERQEENSTANLEKLAAALLKKNASELLNNPLEPIVKLTKEDLERITQANSTVRLIQANHRMDVNFKSTLLSVITSLVTSVLSSSAIAFLFQFFQK